MIASMILLPLLSAGPQSTCSSWTKQACMTSYASSSCPVTSTTQTKSYTIPWVQTTVITPSTTVTLAPSTTTITTIFTGTSTVTGLQVIATTTSTATSTETDTSTTTITSTEIDTATSTVTTTVGSTFTISTVSGFTPFASVSSVVQAGGGSRQKRDLTEIEEREAEPEKRTAPTTSCTASKTASTKSTSSSASTKTTLCTSTKSTSTSSTSTAKASATFLSDCDKEAKYPKDVKCQKVIVSASITYKTSTASKTTTFTVGNPTTSTVTITITSSTTTTVLPAVITQTSSTTTTSTITATATATSAVTSTTTVSTTTTSNLPVQTAYAACAADNLINKVGTNNINDIVRLQGTTVYRFANSGTADDCCVACQTTANCAGFSHRIPISGNANPACDLILANTCTNPTFQAFRAVGRSRTPISIATVGDGPCGQGTWGGVTNT